MQITYVDNGIIFIRIREGKVARTKERAGDVHVDVDERGEVLSIELWNGKETSVADLLAVFQEFGLDKNSRWWKPMTLRDTGPVPAIPPALTHQLIARHALGYHMVRAVSELSGQDEERANPEPSSRRL